MLKNKTRILVTHGISYLPQTDIIIVLNGGHISEVGTYRKLLHNRGAFSEFLRAYLTEDPDALEDVVANDAVKNEILEDIGVPRPSIISMQGRSTSIISQSSVAKVRNTLRRDAERQGSAIELKNLTTTAEKQAEKGKLVEVERSETGGVKWAVYGMLAKQMSYAAVLGIALFYGISYGSSVGANFWLSDWARDTNDPGLATSTMQRDYRLGIYALLGLIQGRILAIIEECHE